MGPPQLRRFALFQPAGRRGCVQPSGQQVDRQVGFALVHAARIGCPQAAGQQTQMVFGDVDVVAAVADDQRGHPVAFGQRRDPTITERATVLLVESGRVGFGDHLAGQPGHLTDRGRHQPRRLLGAGVVVAQQPVQQLGLGGRTQFGVGQGGELLDDAAHRVFLQPPAANKAATRGSVVRPSTRCRRRCSR